MQCGRSELESVPEQIRGHAGLYVSNAPPLCRHCALRDYLSYEVSLRVVCVTFGRSSLAAGRGEHAEAFLIAYSDDLLHWTNGESRVFIDARSMYAHPYVCVSVRARLWLSAPAR